MGCDDEKLSKYLTHTFMAHCHTMICQQVTLSGAAEWPKVADAVIEATESILNSRYIPIVWKRNFVVSSLFDERLDLLTGGEFQIKFSS
jgi:hypothetical protein